VIPKDTIKRLAQGVYEDMVRASPDDPRAIDQFYFIFDWHFSQLPFDMQEQWSASDADEFNKQFSELQPSIKELLNVS
jgi:hypothetical protein